MTAQPDPVTGEFEAVAYRIRFAARPPFHVERFPIGAAICNANGLNCIAYDHGAVFAEPAFAERLAAHLNSKGPK